VITMDSVVVPTGVNVYDVRVIFNDVSAELVVI